MNPFYKNMTHRSEMVLGKSVIEKLSGVNVIIFGLGGVGSWCAEGLVRTGLINLTIVDSDIICPTNINRQIQATSLNIGKSKALELKKRLLEINPSANIDAKHTTYDETTYKDFNLGSFNYVIDAIDSIKNKILLIEQCTKSKIKFFSSMGAAAKTDPTRVKIDLLSNTKNCPLARIVRRNLRKQDISTDFPCVYSDELPLSPASESLCGTGNCACSYARKQFACENDSEPVDWCGSKKQINGALVHITGTFGFMLTGMIINDIIKI
jgi:tRNA threonylcarbamoyladenosine dehydratase